MSNLKIEGCELGFLPLSDIDEGTRFREDYGDLVDLIHSIKTQGIINPISVYRTQEGRYVLIAGGRRLHACREIDYSPIPVRIFTKALSELELRVLELAENIQRKDMEWHEEAKLKREIHNLQQKLHGTPVPGPTSVGGWKMEDTATMLGVSKSNISQAIALANNMDTLSDIVDFKSMKNAKEATNQINHISEALLRSELAKRAEKNKAEGSFLQSLYDSFKVGDAFEGMKELPDSSFDFCLLDPPYGIELDKVKIGDTSTYTEVAQQDYLIFMKRCFAETFRLLKDNTFCICWFGIDPWFEFLYQLATEAGFTGSRIPGLWAKPSGQSMNPTQSLANAYEAFFIFKKGSPVLAKPGRINIFHFPHTTVKEKYHPTQKPLELAQEIFSTFSFENSKTIVPFLGSGVDILAGASLKRQVEGFDTNEEHKGGFIQAAQRLFGNFT